MRNLPHSFIPAVVAAHRDVLRAFYAMPKLVGIVAFIIVAQALLDVIVVNRLIPRESLFGHDIVLIVQEFLITPFLIAVHRFIILGEVTPNYVLQPYSARFQMFFGWQVVVLVATRISEPLILMLGKKNPVGYPIVAFILIAVVVAVTRMTILFPAIAVDAPGTTLRNAIRDTKGHGWYIFFLFLFSCVPIVVVAIVAASISLRLFGAVAGRVLILLVTGAAVVALLAIAVAIASRLYLALGEDVNRPAASAPS